MANIFQNILVPKVRKSVFDLSYENKLSFDMGQLVPIYQENVVPGDKLRVNTEVLLRFAPMLAPIMHRVNCYVHYFFVPYRLIWDDWQEFITGGEDGLSQPVFPRLPLTESDSKFAVGTLADYLGYNFPNDANTSPSIAEYSLLPFRAYQMIYNEYYRDQNLTNEVQISKASGDSTTTDNLLKGTDYSTADAALYELTKLRYRAWEKDYFTSALPWVQRGVAAQIPFGNPSLGLTTSGELNSLLDVYQKSNLPNSSSWQRTISGQLNQASTSGQRDEDLAFGGSRVSYSYRWKDDGTSETKTPSGSSANLMATGEGYNLEANGVLSDINLNGTHAVSVKQLLNKLKVDGLTAPTINELRLAEHIQKWLERNARGGARYIEQILSHFGVRVPDYRLDRPEYLGGGKSPVQISEVLQTSATDDVTPQANMAGHGYSVGNKNKFSYKFDEHGIVLGIMSVLPRTSYQDGVSRHLMKFDKFDYYFPEFAHLGEQEVKNCEVYNGTTLSEDPLGTFGYQERYAEYKYRSGEVHGDFKTNLDFWHLGRKFQGTPSLNTSFVTSDPSKRIFAVEDGAHMWCQLYNNVRAVRPMPKHAIPSL